MLKLVAVAVVLLLVASKFLVFNTTASLPIGLYFKTNLTPKKGDIVLLCPPVNSVVEHGLNRKFISPGLCPGAYGYLIKVYAAEAGDQISLTQAGITINNQLWPNSARQNWGQSSAQGLGQAFTQNLDQNFESQSWPDIHKQLEAHEVIVMTEHKQSFDSRYFGIVPEANIVSPLIPLWTKE